MYRRVVDSNKYLYHYTSFDNYKLIMQGLSLRFNYFSKMNDPKESKYWTSSLIDNDFKYYISETSGDEKKENINLYYNYNTEKEKLFENLKNKIQIISFTQDFDLSNKNQENAYLFRGFGNSYFWAHYGNKQSGICFQFSRNKIEERLCDLKSDWIFDRRIVNYDNNVNEGNPQFIKFSDLKKGNFKKIVKDCIIDNHDYYLFTKTKFWEPENEYRIVLFNEKEEHIYLNIDECISSIIIGEDIEENEKSTVIEIAKGGKISVAQISWGNGYPTAVTICEQSSAYD